MKEYKDSILIQRLKKGEEKAYVFLLDKYHKRMYAYALTLIENHAAAEDIVQNVFLNTWKSRKILNEKYAIESFLFKAVYNEFLNTYKKDKSVFILQMKYYETMSEVVEHMDDTFLKKMMMLVSSEIEKLPPKCKQVFLLSKKEGLSNIEIAEHLGVSLKTIEAQITKSFSVLRERLSEHYYIIVLIFGKIISNFYTF